MINYIDRNKSIDIRLIYFPRFKIGSIKLYMVLLQKFLSRIIAVRYVLELSMMLRVVRTQPMQHAHRTTRDVCMRSLAYRCPYKVISPRPSRWLASMTGRSRRWLILVNYMSLLLESKIWLAQSIQRFSRTVLYLGRHYRKSYSVQN